MKRTRSIRFRLTAWYLIALTTGLALFAAAIWFSMRHGMLAETDGALAERSHKLSVFLNRELVANPAEDLKEELDEYALVLPEGILMQIRDSRGAVYFSSAVDFPFPTGGAADAAFSTVRWRKREYRALSQRISLDAEPFQIEVASSLETIEAMLGRLLWLMLASIPAVIAAASLGGYWLSRRALQPVDEITAAARSIGIENLSERLVVPPTGDELERLSETWNGMLARLESAVKRLSQFTADAAHELRTPLAVIRSTAEVAARRPRPAEGYRGALGRIVTESEAMTQLVDDLLFLARCDSAATEMPMRTLDLVPLVEAVRAEFAARAESKGVRLLVETGVGSAPVSGNHSALRRLVFALVDNAIKYSSPGGDVRVDLVESEGGVALTVRDTGMGIPEQALPHIFERFYRAEDARMAANEGHGLGLSLAKGIALRHGTSIQVVSAQGQGTMFSVEFPAARDSQWRARLPESSHRM